MSYTHGMISGQGFWIKGKEYKGWRIYLIFRALANNRQKSKQGKVQNTQKFLSNHILS